MGAEIDPQHSVEPHSGPGTSAKFAVFLNPGGAPPFDPAQEGVWIVCSVSNRSSPQLDHGSIDRFSFLCVHVVRNN